MTDAAGLPRAVRSSIAWWLIAVAAGVIETVVHVFWGGDGIVTQVLIRVVVYGLVTALILQLRHGRNWARIALTVLLGGVGLVSLLAEPISWWSAGGSPTEFLSSADAPTVAVIVVRAVHVVAVLAGLGWMYAPAASRFFRPASPANPTLEH